jgi:hypothetical protein
VEQLDVVAQAHKNIGAVHRGIEKAGVDAQHHRVHDEADKKHEARQQEQIGGGRLLPHQSAAALRRGLRFCFCDHSQEDSPDLSQFYVSICDLAGRAALAAGRL